MDGAFALVMKPLLYLKMVIPSLKKKLVYYVLCYFFKGIFNAVADCHHEDNGSVMGVARSWKPSITVYITYRQPTLLNVINISSRFVRSSETMIWIHMIYLDYTKLHIALMDNAATIYSTLTWMITFHFKNLLFYALSSSLSMFNLMNKRLLLRCCVPNFSTQVWTCVDV